MHIDTVYTSVIRKIDSDKDCRTADITPNVASGLVSNRTHTLNTVCKRANTMVFKPSGPLSDVRQVAVNVIIDSVRYFMYLELQCMLLDRRCVHHTSATNIRAVISTNLQRSPLI